jgi:hypothetical protein
MTTTKILIIANIINLFFMFRADLNEFKGRVVYHSQCSISQHPVQYDGFSGKVSVRRYWYIDTISGERIKATWAQRKECDAVKVLVSTKAEVLKAEELKRAKTKSHIIGGLLVALLIFSIWFESKYIKWRADQTQKERERAHEIYLQRLEEERLIKEKVKEGDRLRSKRANEERAARKAAKTAFFEERRLANLEKKKNNK